MTITYNCGARCVGDIVMPFQVLAINLDEPNALAGTALTGFTNALGELVHVTATYVLDGDIYARNPCNNTTIIELNKVRQLQSDKSLTRIDDVLLVPSEDCCDLTAFIDCKASYQQRDRTYKVTIAGSDKLYCVTT